jgi:hypothetical protein
MGEALVSAANYRSWVVPDSTHHCLCQGDLLVGFPPHLHDALQEIGLPRR